MNYFRKEEKIRVYDRERTKMLLKVAGRQKFNILNETTLNH